MQVHGANILMGGLDGRFDGHAHVFDTRLKMEAGRRYTPRGDAQLSELVSLLREHAMAGVILVQPSFLRYDNAHLLTNLAAAREYGGLRFRGVAMLPRETPLRELERQRACGVIGVRLNLVARRLPDLSERSWRDHFRHVNRLGWHVELHVEGERLPGVLPALLERCDRVVVDHFGRPDFERPLESEGFAALLSAPADRLMVKVSGPYRVFPERPVWEAAQACAPLFRALAEHLGPGGLVWGSDWPWTQHEQGHEYGDTLSWLELWASKPKARRAAGQR